MREGGREVERNIRIDLFPSMLVCSVLLPSLVDDV